MIRVRNLVGLLAALAVPACVAQGAGSVRYTGTVGQQRVSLSLQLADDAIAAGEYAYTSQKSAIHIVDSRVIGSTVILEDEDGNILHLHFAAAGGARAGTWKDAAMLEGTLDRNDLDLPVKLTREQQLPKP